MTSARLWLQGQRLIFMVLVISSPNRGRDVENMVYLELRRRGYEVMTGQVPGGEIDFLARRDGHTTYIQVALSTESEQTLQRELAPFNHTPAGAHCLLLTGDRFAPATGDVKWMDVFDLLAGEPL